MMSMTRCWAPLLLLGVGCSGEVGPSSGQQPSPDPSGTFAPAQYDSAGNPIPPAVGATPGTSASVPGAVPSAPAVPPVDAQGTPQALPMRLDAEPEYARAIRLTHDQWENSVRYLLAIDETGQRLNLAEDITGFYAFSNHEELLFLNANLYNDYQMAAEELAAAIGMDPDAIRAIHPNEDARDFIETVGRRAFRRPLSETEVQALQGLYDEGAGLTENGSTPHARGAALVLQALMQSPYFLYRLETGDAGTRLSGYELAAKLSLLLLDTTPDDELLDRAGNGDLDNDDGVQAIVSDMLASEGASATLQKFHGELFHFDRFLQISKDPETVPEYTEDLNEELESAAYLFFDRIFREDLGVSEILTSTTGFAGPLMAPLYGVTISGQGVQEVELGPERPGFFTHLPFLIQNSVNLVPDSIHRGVALNLEVLCAEVPPPSDAMVVLLPITEGQTNRERVTATSGPNTCGATCHAPYINPLGFAFENYDGMGRLRTTDNGKPIDTKSAYPFVEGMQEFDGAKSLMNIMATGEQAHSCYAKHLATFALQRELTEDDRDELDAITADSRAGTSVKDLLSSIVTSPAFVTRHTGGTE